MHDTDTDTGTDTDTDTDTCVCRPRNLLIVPVICNYVYDDVIVKRRNMPGWMTAKVTSWNQTVSLFNL